MKILTSKGWAKVYRTDISKGIEYIDQFKIIVGRFVPSNGEMSVKPGEGYRVLTEPQILSPAEINTETYIDTAVFSTLEEATNYKKYLSFASDFSLSGGNRELVKGQFHCSDLFVV